MKVVVNGKETEVASGITILSLLEGLKINPYTVVVEHNYDIPERIKWGDIVLGDGEKIEIVKFMGGG